MTLIYLVLPAAQFFLSSHFFFREFFFLDSETFCTDAYHFFHFLQFFWFFNRFLDLNQLSFLRLLKFSLCIGIHQPGLFSIAAFLPGKYISMLVNGNAWAGVVVSTIYIFCQLTYQKSFQHFGFSFFQFHF